MTRPIFTSFLVAALLAIFCQHSLAQTERYFPESTKGYMSIANLKDFVDRLDKTSIGDLRRNPEAKDFFNSFVQQVKIRIQKKSKVSFGLTLDELKAMVEGELSIGLVQPQENVLAVITLAEFKDAKLVDQALAKIQKNLLQISGEEEKVTLVQKITEGGHSVSHYEFPDPFGIAGPPQVFYGRTDKYVVAYSGPVLPATDKKAHVAEVKKLLKALAGEKQPSLADRELFQNAMASLADGEEYSDPQIKWFVESFGFIDAAKKVWPDQLKDVQFGAFRKVGFDAIKAVGGLGLVTPGDREFQVRAFLYAPPVDDTNRFRLAAKMLDFTADENRLMDLPGWIDQTASSYLAVHGRMLNGFDSAEPLIDELYGESTMARILDNFRQNPKLKANFDLRKELVANLRDRVIAIRAPQFPAKLENNRVVFAIDIAKESESNGTSSEKKNENDPMSRREQVWKVVKGYMANEDPNFVETLTHKVNDEEITIFKKTLPREDTGEEPMDLELDDLDNLDDLDAELDAKPENGDGNGKAIIQYFCVTVFKDQILISPDLPFLKQVLDQFGENKKSTLPEMDWFQKVNSELDKVKNPTFEGLRYILRLDLPYKAAYQLIEESKGDLPLEKMVKDLMGEDRETRLFDIKKLPKNFDKTIAPYLGYIGWSMTTEKDGWLFNGIVVRKPKAAKTSD